MIEALATSLLLSLSGVALPLFTADDPLELRLEGPLSAVMEHKATKDSRPFMLDHSGKRYPVEVRARGNSRLRVCYFPPLRIRFRDAGDVFDGLGKTKLVTHCRSNKYSEHDVLEEYAVYRMFNVLTDVSLRVRLVHLTYAESGESDISRYAFFLEPEKAMATRIGMRPSALREIPVRRLDQQQAALAYIFAYMVGNTDWSLVTADSDTVCCHNEIVLEQDDGGLHIVPYDFDLVGLVDAKHAKPDPSLRMSSVKKRRYRGYCTDRANLRQALERIVLNEARFMEILDSLPLLSPKEKASKKRYLAGFFRQAGNPERLLNKFEKSCL